MPSFDYFATFDESIVILKDLCEQGFRIVAEPGPFEEPSAPTFEQVDDELVALLKIAPAFYFEGSFSRLPVQFIQLDSGEYEGKYVVDLAAEGPLFQALIARVNDVDGMPKLLPGTFSYQSEYRNPENNQWHKASPEVKEAYKKLVSIVKKRCVRHKANRNIFIGTEALAHLRSGEVQILAL
jgi:hypothetical protein